MPICKSRSVLPSGAWGEREYRPFSRIRDACLRFLFTLDPLLQRRDGVLHLNLLDFMASGLGLEDARAGGPPLDNGGKREPSQEKSPLNEALRELVWVAASANRVATVYTSAPNRRREPIFADLCTLLHPHGCPQQRNSVHKCPTTHPPAHGKPHSAPTMPPRRDQGRILSGRRHGKAHFACGPHQKAHSACGRSRRVRFSVTCRLQNALFRRVRLSSPGQTRRRLTENRTLRLPAHGKPHSAPTMPPRRDQGRILGGRRHGKAHFAVLLAHYMPVAKAAEMAATLVSTGVQGLASRRKAQVRSPAARQGA